MKKHVFYLIISLLFIIPISVTAQRLTKLQEKGTRAPENVSIDGKTTEWRNKPRAYNNDTQIYYTIANDDEKLYLFVQAADALVIRKIIAGGITFSITPPDSKSAKDIVAVTYPLFNKDNWPEINLRKKPLIIKDTLIRIELIDSFMRASNWQLDNRSGQIKVTGGKGLRDTLISVNNYIDIKAVCQLDPQLAYNYELAIPLKYLGLAIGKQEIFTYKIALNGSRFSDGNTIEDVKGGGTRLTITGTNKFLPMADMQFIRYPASFSGSYSLAK